MDPVHGSAEDRQKNEMHSSTGVHAEEVHHKYDAARLHGGVHPY